MAAYKPWLTIDSIALPSPTHPLSKKPQNFIPKYDLDDNISREQHIKQFMDALKLMNVEHEDVVCRLFPHTLQGKATKWFFNLAPRSVTSWDKFEEAFVAEFSVEETPGILPLDLLGIRMNENEKVKYFNERFMSLLNGIPIKPIEIVQIEHYVSALPPNIAMFVKTQRKLTLVANFAEAIQVEKDCETMSSCLGNEKDEVLTESDVERIISQLQDEITKLKKDKGEGKKHVEKKTSTNTSLKVPPTPEINLEEYALDNFCHTHGTYHSEKTCPKFLNSFYALLLPPRTPEKENNGVEEENYEDEESELKEVQHPPSLILNHDEIKLYNMDVDEIEEEKHEDD
jgi:hypothetical protein